MSVQQMLELGRAPVAKLIIGTGEVAKGAHRGISSLGFIITSRLLSQCHVPPADIHDPSVVAGRSGHRDEHGYDVKGGEAFSAGGSNPASSSKAAFTKVMSKGKGKAAWANNPFQNYEGLYCDRLACGSPPERVAVLQPHTGLNKTGGPMRLVMSAHRQLDVSDVLIVYPTGRIPFGGAVLSTLRGTERAGLVDPLTQGALISASEAVASSSETQSECIDACLDLCILSVGIGGVGTPLHSPMDPAVLAAIKNLVAPKMAFACAYWCSTPAKAAQFLAKDFRPRSPQCPSVTLTDDALLSLGSSRRLTSQSPTAGISLVSSSAASVDPQQALFQSMQKPLLSSTDQSILSAYAIGMGVMERSTMNEAGTMVAAQRILDDVRDQGLWKV